MNFTKTNQKHYLINKVAVFSFIILGLLTILTSCSKDDAPTTPEEGIEVPNETMPTMTLVSGEDGIYLGVVGSPTQGSLQHQVKATAPDGFVSLEIFKILDDVATSYISFDANHPNYVAGSNTFTHTLNYIMNDVDEPGRGLRFKAVVTDANNNIATLDFAEVDLRLPMLKRTVTLETTFPPVGDITIPYYLNIKGVNVNAVNHDVAVDVDNDEFIAFAFSANDALGYYLGSLSVIEPAISNGMAEKSTTKFKHHINASAFPIFTYRDIYDVHNIEHAFSVLSFNSQEQKAEQVSESGKVFYFKTDDNRTGMFQIKNFNIVGNDASIELDLFVTQQE